jgi:hypothetical protein
MPFSTGRTEPSIVVITLMALIPLTVLEVAGLGGRGRAVGGGGVGLGGSDISRSAVRRLAFVVGASVC